MVITDITDITDIDVIVSFLIGDGTDHQNRKFGDHLAFDNLQIEYCHDSIQWLFPLHEESNHALTFPLVTKELVEKAKSYPKIKENLREAKKRMDSFFGIGDFDNPDRQREWCKPFDHNLLRITRIIRCLRLFGLEEEANDFYHEVKEVGEYLGATNVTLGYWARAMIEDVWESLR